MAASEQEEIMPAQPEGVLIAEILSDAGGSINEAKAEIATVAQHADHEWLMDQATTHISRFLSTHKLEDVDAAIEYLNEVISLLPPEHQDIPTHLNNLGFSLQCRFERLGNFADLEDAIKHQQRAVSLTPEGHPDMPVRLNNLSRSLQHRFQRLGNLADLDKSIDHQERAVALAPDGHPDAPIWLNNLGHSLQSRFGRLGKLADLNRAIEHQQYVILHAPERHPDKPIWLDNLGCSLQNRFGHLGGLADLDKAIEYQEHAVLLIPDEHPKMPVCVNNLGHSLLSRSQRLGNLADLNMAIECQQYALSLAPKGHPDMPIWLNNLGSSLQNRSRYLDNLADLNKAIEHQQRALSLAPSGHPDRPFWLNNLGSSLRTRFERLGTLADLDKAIEEQQNAISFAPEGHPNMSNWLHDLAHSFLRRCERLGTLTDLDKATEHQKRAISVAPEGHPDMPRWLNNLGSMHQHRFERLGNLRDLDEAIEHQQHAASLTAAGDRNMAMWLSNLGHSLGSRFERLDDLADLNKAVEYLGYATSHVLGEQPGLPIWLDNLGNLLRQRFKRLGNRVDLDKAIEHQQHAASLTPVGHPYMPIRLSNLGHSLWSMFIHLDDSKYLNKALEHAQQAVLIAPEGHPHMPIWLNNLGSSLRSRYQHLGDLADLNKAVEHQQRAVSLAPPEHPDMPIWLSDLAQSLEARFYHLGDNIDLDQSISFYQKAAVSLTGNPRWRFRAALGWAEACRKHQTGSLLDAYKQAMGLLPQLVWLGGTVINRYNNILDVGGICARAVAAAIDMKDYQSALEWLEEGRSIVWKQMLQLRAPLDDLSTVHPTLALQLKQVAHDLEHAGFRRKIGTATEPSKEHSLEHTAREHRRLAERWEELVTQARQIPEFKDFLRPRRASELVRSAHSGAIVAINMHEDRCDALVIRPYDTEISHVSLVNFSLRKAADIFANWKVLVRGWGSAERAFIKPRPKHDDILGKTLAVLWEELVHPVLDFLGYNKSASLKNLPHVTWCSTGPISFLPLHAAGNYGTNSMAYNYVISSYTPTLTALLSPAQLPAAFTGILVVGQKSTPGLPSLPGTEAEIAYVQEQLEGYTVTRLDGSSATPPAVLAGMEEHGWVHFACHAIQNTSEPTESAFHLHGGTLDLATITQKQLKHAELAFLSACETATGDGRLPDEAIHLAAGMLMAGYRTVVATMWSIGDKDAPLIAKKVYEDLVEGGVPDSRRAATAVHNATKYLRDKVGVKAYEKWAPYIHIGL